MTKIRPLVSLGGRIRRLVLQGIVQPYHRRGVSKAVRLLKTLDSKMVKAGYARQERRRFWRDFVKSQAVREELFNGLDEGNKRKEKTCQK